MLRKRLIFSLIYSDGYFNQSRNFRLQKVGDIKWLENNYNFKKIAFSLDELIILNASRCNKDFPKFIEVLNVLAEGVFIPIAAGGGIKSVEDAAKLFNNGADKVILNSILWEKPNVVKNLIKKYGSQSILASIDYKKNNVYIRNGTYKIDKSLFDYIKYVENLGVGEILLNSIEKDGTGFGYDIEVIKKVNVSIPLIIMGGAGNEKHLEEGLSMNNVDAVATANLFNFVGNGLINARRYLIENGYNLARWSI